MHRGEPDIYRTTPSSARRGPFLSRSSLPRFSTQASRPGRTHSTHVPHITVVSSAGSTDADECSNPSPKPDKEIWRDKVSKRREAVDDLEAQRRQVRGSQLLHDLGPKLLRHARLGEQRYSDIHYDDSLAQVEYIDIQDAKKRKVAQQRRRRRERALLIVNAERQRARERLSQTRHEEDRIKLLELVRRSDRRRELITRQLRVDLPGQPRKTSASLPFTVKRFTSEEGASNSLASRVPSQSAAVEPSTAPIAPSPRRQAYGQPADVNPVPASTSRSTSHNPKPASTGCATSAADINLTIAKPARSSSRQSEYSTPLASGRNTPSTKPFGPLLDWEHANDHPPTLPEEHRRGEPGYDMNRLKGSHAHGKRAADGDHVRRKRKKVSEVDKAGVDRNEAPAKSPQPVATTVDGTRQITTKNGMMVRWRDKEERQLLQMKCEGRSWEDIFDAIPRHTHGASRKKYSDLLKTYYKPSAEHDLPVQDDDQAPGARIASNPRNTLPGAPKVSTAPEASQLSIETDLFMNGIPDELPSNVASMRDPEGVFSSQSGVGRTSAAQSQHLTRRLIRRGAEGQKKPQPKSFSEDLDGRSYEKYQSRFGMEKTPHGLLLPRKYNMAESAGTGMPWVCPIRSCRYQFKMITSLGKHWKTKHQKCLLNDNNDGTFSIRADRMSSEVDTTNAIVISRDPLDPNEPPMTALLNITEIQLAKARRQRDRPAQKGVDFDDREETDDEESEASKESSADGVEEADPAQVFIPSDPDWATNLRAYNEWPDSEGKLVETRGVLLPSNYRPLECQGFEWVCPIRSCRRVLQSLSSLNGHTLAAHRAKLLNDNRDGTFTILGNHPNYWNKRKNQACTVKSKESLGSDASPMAELNVPLWDAETLRAFTERREAWLRSELERLRKNKPVTRSKTVDEIMAQGGGAERLRRALESSESSDEPGMASIPESELSPSAPLIVPVSDPDLPSRASTEVPGEPEEPEEAGVVVPGDAGPPDLTQSTAKENWGIIEALFTDRRFPPPDKGPLHTLLSTPRVRGLEVGSGPRNISVLWPKDMSLLIVQLSGIEAPKPCSRCERGAGLFQTCVMLSEEVASLLQHGVCSCVNCAWKSAHHGTCDLKSVLREVEREADEEAPTQPSAVEDNEDDSLRSLRDRRSERRLSDVTATRDEPKPSAAEQRSLLPAGSPPEVGSMAADAEADVGNNGFPVLAEPSRAKGWVQSQVDERFAFEVIVVPPGTSLRLELDASNLRICTLAVGKVVVLVPGEPAFTIGFQGMFRLIPGATAVVVNAFGIEAVLHVSSFGKGK